MTPYEGQQIMPEYTSLVETLKWKCIQDSLFRDGMDHYQIDQSRFERAAKMLAPLSGSTICDIGSFPGYDLWAFRECSRYTGMGKCPAWYESSVRTQFGAEWLGCDLEADPELPATPIFFPVRSSISVGCPH